MLTFASHDWGVDGANHARVARVVQTLRDTHSLEVWFDETHLRGNLVSSMCKGIDDCVVFLVFLTRNYMNKVEAGGDEDNVRLEFMYAPPEKMLVVRFDHDLPARWSGPVGMYLNKNLYVEASDASDKQIAAIAHAVRERTKSASEFKKKKVAAFTNAVRERTVARKKTPNTERVVSVRERVHHALAVMGEAPHRGEHVHDTVNRLLRSLAGSTAVTPSAPFEERLRALECHLGVA